MKASDISEIIRSVKERMPESSRTLLAHKFIKKIGEGLDEKTLKEWADSGGPQQFMDDCELSSGAPFVHHEISVEDTELAEFCNKWMNVEQYKDPETDEWKPVSPEMNQIRYTMVKELENLWKSSQS